MATDPSSTMNPNVKIFLSVFLFIGGFVGIVLAVLNASQKPAATTTAALFGVVGVLLLVGAVALTRKRRY